MWFVWLVLGAVLGAAAVWYWREQNEGTRVAEVQGSWEAKYRHALEDVKRADAAHEETKERLRAAESRVAELETEKSRLEARLAELEGAAKTEPTAPAPTAAAAPPPRRGDARLKQIEAKLAQLPAGSSARKALLAERDRLRAAKGVPAGGRDGGEDLKRIKGIGPTIETKLKAMGITSIAQIAELGEADVARIEERLAFKGRITRERWIEQAREMLAAERS